MEFHKNMKEQGNNTMLSLEPSDLPQKPGGSQSHQFRRGLGVQNMPVAVLAGCQAVVYLTQLVILKQPILGEFLARS